MPIKPSFVVLSTTIILTVGVVGLKHRDTLSNHVEALLGNTTLTPTPQLMRMGRISGPDFKAYDEETPQPGEIQIAQADQQSVNAVPDNAADAARQQRQPRSFPAPTTAASTPIATPVPAVPATPVQAAAGPEAPAAPKPQPTAVSAPATAPEQPAVDESALRYFASRGDKARLQAEISRLQALYPSWTPPADPLAVPQNQDKQLEAMWQLYSEAHYAELRKAISERQTSEAGWQPPADLIDRLNVAEARTRLVNASDLKQYATVIDTASQTPSLLTCSETDVLWRVADAFANTDRLPRAKDAYNYIMKNCQNTAERLATIQKASALMPYSTMQDLLSQEKPLGDGTREFDSIRDDLARRFVGEANEDAKLVIAPDYVSRLERLTEAQGLASDALLLGWYNLRREDMPAAEKWFRIAHTKEDTASASQGLALALIARKAPQEAEDIMYKWRDASNDAAATYVAAAANLLAIDPPVILPVDVLQRIAGVVLKTHDTPAAQQFGWYARGLNQPQTAAQWFQTALSWKADDEPSAYGLVITLNQLNDRGGVADVQRRWAGRSERIARLGEIDPNQQLARLIPSAPLDGYQTQAISNQPAIGQHQQSQYSYSNSQQAPAAYPSQQPAQTGYQSQTGYGAQNSYGQQQYTQPSYGYQQPVAMTQQQGYSQPQQSTYVYKQQQQPSQVAYVPPQQPAYTAPQPQAYTAPQQQAYVPQQQTYTQQPYTQPAQQTYTQPAARSYTQPPVQPPAYTPPKPQPVEYQPRRVPRYTAPAQPVQTIAVRGPRPATVRTNGCATTVNPETLDPTSAVPRGWCLMNLNRPVEAAAAFEIGLRSPVPKDRQDAAYGQSLAYLRLDLSGNAAVAAVKAPQTRQRATELQTAILVKRASAAYDEKRYRESILYLDQLRQIQPDRIDLMVLRGYAYLNMKRFSDAIRIFEAAAATGNKDAISALSNARDAQKNPPTN